MIDLLVVLVILGVILYLVETFIPMDPAIKIVIRVVVVILLCLFLQRNVGIADVALPKLR